MTSKQRDLGKGHGICPVKFLVGVVALREGTVIHLHLPCADGLIPVQHCGQMIVGP